MGLSQGATGGCPDDRFMSGKLGWQAKTRGRIGAGATCSARPLRLPPRATGVAGGVKLSRPASSRRLRRRPGRLPAVRPAVQNRYEVKPGELDEYYVFFSSGQTGEVRIVGLPSMRELMRVPVFNRDSATGWGQTNESIKVLTEGLTPGKPRVPEGQGRDLHQRRSAPPASVLHGRTYDGRYLFANDKSNTACAAFVSTS